MKTLIPWTLLASIVILVLAGCAAPSQEVVVTESVGANEDENDVIDVDGASDDSAPTTADPYAAEEDQAMEEEAPASEGDDDRGGGEGAGGPAESPSVVDEQFQPDLSAGEINDNSEFDAYLQYRRDYARFVGLANVLDVDVSQRHMLRITTPDGLPVLGATVTIYDGQNLLATLQTNATGIAYVFPLAYTNGAANLNVTVRKGDAVEQLNLEGETGEWDVVLDTDPAEAPVQLDVMFLIDATGSMDDEIAQLKENILSISAQVAALPSQPNVRFGMVHYRDRGDEYVTRITQFTGSIDTFQSALLEVQAAGGGDEPESLNEGMHRAIWDVDWRQEDTVKLMFLVADAPPHLDYQQDFDYAQEMANAASFGIKVHPIASSGLNAQGEYIFRQIAQFTGGNFIFLTYDSQPQASGEPGRDDVSVPDYTVEDLDALVVRLIRDELAALFGPIDQQ
ncbi:MAG: VWA domain-containing protein [Chloroflexi bacterium]|nr:VWA domain-containing protein [Chloroflexota bacterium]